MARVREHLEAFQSQDLQNQLMQFQPLIDPETMLKRDSKTGASKIDDKYIEEFF